jgi:hypothetical protein
MLDYQKYVMRHGESWIQDIVEKIELHQGIRCNAVKTLEERWARAMQDNISQQDKAA